MTIGPRIERLCVGAFVLSLLGGAVIVMSFFELPAANRDVVFQLVGGINALAGLVVGGYFRDMKRDDSPPASPFDDYPRPQFGDEK